MELKHGAFESTIPTEPSSLESRRGSFASWRLRLTRRRRCNWLGSATDIKGEEVRCGSLMRVGIEYGQRDFVAEDAVGLGFIVRRWGLVGGGGGGWVRERTQGFVEIVLSFWGPLLHWREREREKGFGDERNCMQTWGVKVWILGSARLAFKF